MRCLVTGAAGFVGSHLSERLLAAGHQVLGVDCFTPYYDRALKEANLTGLRASAEFSFLEVDLSTLAVPALIDGPLSPLKGIDVVFHQAAQAGVRASWGAHFDEYVRLNVLTTQRLLEAVKVSPVKKFIYASSSSVYGNTQDLPARETSVCAPFSPYGVTKLAAEHLAELYRTNFGVPTVSLRYFTVYGPRQRPDMGFNKFIRSALTGAPLKVFGDGKQTRDFTFVDDIVSANILSMKPEALGVFNIGGGSRAPLHEVLQTLERVVGSPLRIEHAGDEPGDVRHTWADTSRAQSVLGFAPSVTLHEGLARQVAWQRQSLR